MTGSEVLNERTWLSSKTAGSEHLFKYIEADASVTVVSQASANSLEYHNKYVKHHVFIISIKKSS